MSTDTTVKNKKIKRNKVGRAVMIILSAILVVILTLLVILLAWSPGKIQPYFDENGNILEGSIAEITKVEIGGIQQGLIIKSKNKQNPVLLFLHGGPGSPEYVFAKNYSVDLEDMFTVCWWDQRGAGMSFDSTIPPESMTLEQMISDTVEVTDYLRERFGQDKIYLMGHSWGSFLGMHVAAQRPELYHAYVGIGQVSDQLTSEKEAYDYMMATALATGDTALVKKLEKYTLVGPETVTAEYLMVRSAGMNKQGIGITHTMTSEWNELLLPLLQCREYTFSEKIGYARGSLFSLNSLFSTVLEQDLAETVPKLEIPVYFCQGIYDYQVSYQGAKDYFDKLQVPIKHFYTFENSAHSPLLEEPEKFRRIMQEDVLGN